MVRQVDWRLVRAVDQFGLVFNPQKESLFAVDDLRPRRVSDLGLDGAGEALVSVIADKSEGDALSALETLHPGNLFDANGRGALPDAFTPAYIAAVQGVGSVVGGQGVDFTVDAVELSALDAVGNTANGLAKVGRVVFHVLLVGGKSKNDVCIVDLDGLYDGSQGEEGERSIWHIGGVWWRKPRSGR